MSLVRSRTARSSDDTEHTPWAHTAWSRSARSSDATEHTTWASSERSSDDREATTWASSARSSAATEHTAWAHTAWSRSAEHSAGWETRKHPWKQEFAEWRKPQWSDSSPPKRRPQPPDTSPPEHLRAAATEHHHRSRSPSQCGSHATEQGSTKPSELQIGQHLRVRVRRKEASEKPKTHRGGWSAKCKLLVQEVLNENWEEAKALAEVYNCDGFMRAMDEHSDGL